MGRIQKKKPAVRKKTKSSPDTSAATPAEAGAPAPPAAVKEVARQPKAPVKKAAAKAPSALPGSGYIEKSMQFLREVKVELKKVTWPTRKQTLGSTLVVVVLVMIISLFLGAVDFGLSSLIRVVLN